MFVAWIMLHVSFTIQRCTTPRWMQRTGCKGWMQRLDAKEMRGLGQADFLHGGLF